MMTLIFTASHIPGNQFPPPSFPNMDKVVHLLIYGVLGLSFLYWFSAKKAFPDRWHLLSTILFCLLYGASDELHQYFIPFRNASLADLVADGCGSVLAVWGWRWWRTPLQGEGF